MHEHHTTIKVAKIPRSSIIIQLNIFPRKNSREIVHTPAKAKSHLCVCVHVNLLHTPRCDTAQKCCTCVQNVRQSSRLKPRRDTSGATAFLASSALSHTVGGSRVGRGGFSFQRNRGPHDGLLWKCLPSLLISLCLGSVCRKRYWRAVLSQNHYLELFGEIWN